MKIAIAGNGGVGKTVIASGIARYIASAGHTTLAIDADESPNLALSLGISTEEASRIVPIMENDRLIRLKTETDYPGVYNLNFSVDDIIRDYSIQTPAGVHLLVMGAVKAMGSGCSCPGNSLIRALLRYLIVEHGEAVILDMEAGVEHLGRGTAEAVDWMLAISDANRKSLATAVTIANMAREAGISHIALVGNRVENDAQEAIIHAFADRHKLQLLGVVPFDRAVIQAGIDGDSILALDGTKAFRAIEDIGKRLMPIKIRDIVTDNKRIDLL